MSLFRRLMIVLGAGGAGYQPELWKDANIFSDYNLCTFPIEELTAQPASTYVVCVEQKEFLTVSPTSTYSLVIS